MKEIELQSHVHGEVLMDEATLKEYGHDYSIFRVKPQAVVFPKNVDDVKSLVRYVNEERKKGNKEISLTGRSAGTDMSGGPLTESIVVEFAKYFNEIKEVGSDFAVTQPGVYYRDFAKEVAKKGLVYPSYPASKDLCAMGGIVNNNSGGERTLQYGQTKDWVESVKLVLSDGEEHEFKPLAGEELEHKLEEESFEGDIYRKLHKLIEDNYDDIMAAKPKVSKNSCGYLLWEVLDKATGVFNIVKLITGSQGTFGLLTEAKMRLMLIPKFNRLLVVFANSLDPAPEIVKAVLPFKPESIESYDDRTLGLAIRFLPAMMRLMKGSLIKLGFSFWPEAMMFVRGGFRLPKMVLLVSVTGEDEKELDTRMVAIRAAVKKFPVQARIIRTVEEAEKYWTIRRQSFALLHSHVKGKDTAPFVDDIIVEPKHMAEFLPKVNAILDRYKDKLIYTIAGHPGNGNFHIIPLADMKDPAVRELIPKVSEEIYKLTVSFGGSITGEHNDGLIRTPYLHLMYSQKILDLFAEVKRIFDPESIFNPGKKTGGSLEYSRAHIKQD